MPGGGRQPSGLGCHPVDWPKADAELAAFPGRYRGSFERMCLVFGGPGRIKCMITCAPCPLFC